MSLAQDASSPAAVVGSGTGSTITTASFSPPAASLLVALVSGESSTSAISATVTDSGGHTWTRMAIATGGSYGGMAGVWVSYLASAPASAITVTASFTHLGVGRMLDLKVITGADPSQKSATGWSAAYGVLGTTAGAINLTTTVPSSLVYGISNCPSRQVGTSAYSAATTVLTAHDNTNDNTEAASWKSTSPTSSPGSTAMGITWAASTSGNVAAFEIMPLGSSPGAPAMPTFTDGSVPHASDLSSISTNVTNLFNITQGGVRWAPYIAGGKGPVKPMCVMTLVAPTTTIPSGSGNAVHFDTALVNSDNGWSAMNDPFIVLRTGGLWRIHFQGQILALTATAEIEAAILYNSLSYPSGVLVSSNANGNAVGCEATVQAAGGSYVWFQLNQYTAGTGSWGPLQATCEWLGP